MGVYEDIVRMWRGWRVASASDIDLRLHSFRVLFAYNSGRIENVGITYHDTREMFENGKAVGFTGDPRALFELSNQRLCYEFLKEKIIDREPLTVRLVLEIHGALTGGTYDERRYVGQGERPGSFKRHDYVTGRMEVGSEPAKVLGDVEELLREVGETVMDGSEDGRIMKVAAYFHARFEHIHPFADGNGRVGRTLLNYYLMVRDHPPIIIHEDEKADYYEALEGYDASEGIMPMHRFLVRQAERTWVKSLTRESGNPKG